MPAARPPRASERAVQISIRHRLMLSGVVCLHIPNEGRRTVTAGRRLKQEGMLRGACDLICIGDAGRVAWLEVKSATGRVSDAQSDHHDMLRRKGHVVAVVRDQDEAVAALRAAGWTVR